MRKHASAGRNTQQVHLFDDLLLPLSLFIHDYNRPLPGFKPQTGHWSEYEAHSLPMCYRALVLQKRKNLS